MAAKTVKVSLTDSGATFNTIPGNTADLNREGNQLDDTVFGQIFQSNQPGLIGWGVTANALYKGFAGYVATLKKQGTSTSMTSEALENISGNLYKVTDASKNLWDKDVALVFNDGSSGNPVIPAGNIKTINHLLGQVEFLGAEAEPITVDGNFLPLVAFGKANSFTLTQTAETVDTTAFEDAQANSGFNVMEQTLLTVSLELGSFYQVSNNFNQILINREEVVIEINPDGNNLSFARGFFKPAIDNQTGDVAGSETESFTYVLSVEEGLGLGTVEAAPFIWDHDALSTLSQAIQDLLTAWQAQAEVQVQYLPDGVAGFQGNAVVIDISLTGGVEVMNEFSVGLQGTGAVTTFP